MKSNITTIKLIMELKKFDEPAWKRVVEELGGSSRRKREVNLSSISRFASGTVLVPGTVLGSGELKSAITVAAVRFSKTAKEKIEKAGGRPITIRELAKENPGCSGVKIMV